nr:hypothetical protein [Wadden Sea poxvirus]
MGIKNLKTLLIKNNSLSIINMNKRMNSYDNVFVDTMSFYISIAHCCNNINELSLMFFEYINLWIYEGRIVTLFIDKGNISIKEPIRIKRRAALKDTIKRKTEEIQELENQINNIKQDDIFYEEIKTDLQHRIFKLMFHVFISDYNNLILYLDQILSVLGDNVKIIYSDGIDAEFKMCLEAKKIADITGKWPLLISTDQDILLFTSIDCLPKTIKNVTQTFKYLPCKKSSYLSKLTVLVNGCDFFSGLYGLCINEKTLPKIKLFDEFNIENILQSLSFKTYKNKNDESKNINIDNIIKFINDYSNISIDIYKDTPPSGITIQDFMFASLLIIWKNFKRNYFDNIPLCSALIYILNPRKDITILEIEKLINVIKNDNKNHVDINNIKLVCNIFGYNTQNINNIIMCIYHQKILLCYNNKFYFNNKIIIENTIKNTVKNSIINIGY